MRRVVLAIAMGVACGGCGEPEPQDTLDTAPAPVEPGQCGTWDEFACLGVGNNCEAQCLPIYKVECETIHCFVQGRGQGGGRSCTITLPDETGCGYCKAAVETCL